jgi:hypothetical protein
MNKIKIEQMRMDFTATEISKKLNIKDSITLKLKK